MKTTILGVIVLMFLHLNILGQKKYSIATAQKDTKEKTNNAKAKVLKEYYCISSKPDSLYLNNDSMIFSKIILNKDFPKLTLFENQKFRFIYGMRMDTIRIVNPSENSIITQIVLHEKTINGGWKFSDSKSSQIIMNYENSSSKFKLKDINNRVYFIKEKKQQSN